MQLVLRKPSADLLIEGLRDEPSAAAFHASLVDKVVRLRATDLNVDLGLLGDGGAEVLERCAREADDRSVIGQIGTWRRILSNPRSARIARLAHLEGALVEWILDGVIKGWIFRRDDAGHLFAWSLENVRLDVGMNREPAVSVQIAANAPRLRGEDGRSTGRDAITFHQSDLPATADELLGQGGWLHETAELHAEYEEIRVRFAAIADQPNAQYRLSPGSYRKAQRSSYAERELVIGAAHRCINDETLVARPLRDAASRHNWDDRVSDKPRGKGAERGPRTIPDDAFQEMPTHFLHLAYDLDAHEHAWVPPQSLREYVYRPELADSIVLPDGHRELIDILTTDADVLVEDVVEGKSGGTAILLEGDPGLGKTLTAEIYSEVMRRPLYRMPAGRLGITPESVAAGIEEMYANAARWGAVVLLDEADVYIRRRGDDLAHNAIMAAVLVAMERQTAISFLATNRSGDVDEAIISRCIAVVRYDMPDASASRAIWRIQADAIGVEISDEDIVAIVAHHAKDGSQRASGRDIRALLKLAHRYNRLRGRPVTADLLRQLGAFKRL